MASEPVDATSPSGIDIISTDRETRLILRGEIDLVVRDVLWDAVDNAVVTNQRLVFDLTDVTFLDSTGLAALARARQRGAAVCVVNPCQAVRRTLEVSGLDTYIQIVDGDNPA